MNLFMISLVFVVHLGLFFNIHVTVCAMCPKFPVCCPCSLFSIFKSFGVSCLSFNTLYLV